MNEPSAEEVRQAVDAELLPAKVTPQLPAVAELHAMTPAQARVDAVANVLHKAYERASTLELNPEQVTRLKADFPDEAFKLGAGGNPDLLYIEHAYLRDRFDEVIGMGQWALVRTKPHWGEDYTTAKGQKATRIYADCALLIKGCLVSEAIGEMSYFHNNASQTYGDAAEGSETAAFRRCAKKLGVGLQAWKKDYCEGWMQRHKKEFRPAQPSQAPTRPAPAAPPKPAETPSRVPTAATKAWFLKQLPEPAKGMALSYFTEVGAILPTEGLEDLPLANVPTTKDELKALLGAIEHFASSGEAVAAFPPHRDAPIIPPKEEAKESAPEGDKPEDAEDAPWRSFVIPFGKMAGKTLAEVDKKFLYGFWAGYTVETEWNGKPKKAETIAKDRAFRVALDDAGRHYEFKKPEDKQ